MSWEDIIKAELYHPITAQSDGWFYKVQFEDGEGQSMGEDLIMHLKYRNWESLESYSTKLYEVHLGMKPELQGQGNAEKMIVGAVLDKNEVLSDIPLLLNYNRILNDKVFSVVEKLKNNSMIHSKEIIDEDYGAIGLLMSAHPLEE